MADSSRSVASPKRRTPLRAQLAADLGWLLQIAERERLELLDRQDNLSRERARMLGLAMVRVEEAFLDAKRPTLGEVDPLRHVYRRIARRVSGHPPGFVVTADDVANVLKGQLTRTDADAQIIEEAREYGFVNDGENR